MVAGVLHKVQYDLPDLRLQSFSLDIAIGDDSIPVGESESFRPCHVAIEQGKPFGETGARLVFREVSGGGSHQSIEPDGVSLVDMFESAVHTAVRVTEVAAQLIGAQRSGGFQDAARRPGAVAKLLDQCLSIHTDQFKPLHAA